MAQNAGIQRECPFPDVAEALRPYIKTRQEATHIRKSFQATLPLSTLNATNPAFGTEDEPSGLSGVRKAYWKALRAHRAAQARYDDLKSDLQQLVHSPSQPASNSNTFLTEEHIPLVRQREKLRQVRVIESTAAKIKANGGDVIGESFDKVAKREVGDVPTPPTQSSFSDREFSSEYDLIQLKKAVLNTKHQLTTHERTIAQINGLGYGDVNPQADLRALQKTHNELTTWMETQLALISKAETTKDSDTAPDSPQPETNGTTDVMTEVEDIYELYIGARKRLLETVTRTPSRDQDFGGVMGGPRRGPDTAELETRAAPSEIVLPYLPKLVSSRQLEQSLLQQSSFARQQLSTVEEQDKAALVRLADESHLLQADLARVSPRGRDWAVAAAQAGTATTKSSMQRIQAGKASTQAASQALAAIKTMPSSVDALLD